MELAELTPTEPIGIGGVLWCGFLVGQLISGLRPILTQLGLPEANLIGTIGLVAGTLMGICAGLIISRFGRDLSNDARMWLGWVSVILIALFAYGWLLQGWLLQEATRDLLAMLLAVWLVALGANPRFWKKCLTPVFYLMVIALLVNLAGMSDFKGLVDKETEQSRVARSSMGYALQNLLDPWFLLLLTAGLVRGWRQWLAAIAVVVVFGQQLLFQKRLETTFVILTVTAYLACFDNGRTGPVSVMGFRGERFGFKLMTCVGLAAVLGLAWFPGIVQGQAKSLLARFQGQGEGQDPYSKGVWSVFTRENERYQIVWDCFGSFEPHEFIAGRGMGGAFAWTSPIGQRLGNLRDDQEQYLLPERTYYGRRNMEVGFAMPLLKGGMLLTLSFYSVYFLLLRQAAFLWHDPFTKACFVFSVLGLVFTLLGGNFALTCGLQMAAIYLPLGWCLRSHFSKCDRSAPPCKKNAARTAIPRSPQIKPGDSLRWF